MKIANFNAISAYYNGKNTFGGWSNTLDRSGAFPVEKYSVFNSIEDALKYVNGEVIASMGATDGKAYDGQIIAVKDATTGIQKAYSVDSTAISGLTPVGDTSDILPVLDQLSDAISANVDSIALNASKITLISNDISAIREATLGNLDALEATLKRDLSIDITENAGTDTGILKTYTLTQGG